MPERMGVDSTEVEILLCIALAFHTHNPAFCTFFWVAWPTYSYLSNGRIWTLLRAQGSKIEDLWLENPVEGLSLGLIMLCC